MRRTIVAFVLALLALFAPPAAAQDSDQAPKKEETKDELSLPAPMKGIKMGMSAKEIQAIRKDAADIFNNGDLKEEPKDSREICAYFGIQTDPTKVRITYYCKEKKLTSIYISFDYTGNESGRDQELKNLREAMTKVHGNPTGSDASGAWDKPEAAYHFGSGVAGSDGYWFAYQIDKK